MKVKTSTGRAIEAERGSGAETQPGSRLKETLVAGFVVFHVLVIPIFAMPVNIWPANWMRELASPYMQCIGMGEAWNTFAPRPKSSEQYLKAIVQTVSGQNRLYSFPRMEELPWIDRYQKERYRKFIESALCKECKGLWPDIERNVAYRECTTMDPAEKVVLIEFESPIDPETGLTGSESASKPTVLNELFLESEDLR